jgi:hypothetical protein
LTFANLYQIVSDIRMSSLKSIKLELSAKNGMCGIPTDVISELL